jgi:hypothetical protein
MEKTKKRGVHRPHGVMMPGNSFPQICVVSVNRIVEKAGMAQEYLRPMPISNQPLN